MGLDVVGPGTGFGLSNDDWVDIDYLAHREPDALNRTYQEIYALVETLRTDPYVEVWAVHDEDGTVAGFVALHLGRKESDRHTASLRVLVGDGMRGRGFGKTLIESALKWADENGITRITATPYVTYGRTAGGFAGYKNDTGRKVAFFRNHGFRTEGIARRAARLADGSLTDVAQLARVRGA